MSNTDSFIEEVSEELRRDRMFRLFRRYGPIVIGALVLLVAGAAYNEWRKAEAFRIAQEKGDALSAVLVETDPAKRAETLNTIASEAHPSALPAAFGQAAALAEAGDPAQAQAVLNRVIVDDSVDPIYRDVARLRVLTLAGSTLTADEKLAMIDLMTGPDAPFRLLALEQRALVQIEAGETEKAKSDIKAIINDPLVTLELTTRVSVLMRAIGGSLDDLVTTQ